MRHPLCTLFALTPLLYTGTAGALLFDDDKLAKLDPVYREECGSCHVPYPAPLLNLKSWMAITEHLERHFKVDASVDAEALKAINGYLKANAATDKLPALDRITRASWFVPKHVRLRSPASAWPKVKTLSHCDACHLESDQGRFGKLIEHKR